MGQAWGKIPHGSGSGRSERSLKAVFGVDHEYSGDTFSLIVPGDILCEVLKWVPAEDIVKSCVYVCKQWRDVINTQTFWKEKLIQNHGYKPQVFHLLVNEDFKKLYFKRPYQYNLIKNHDAREGFIHWKIHYNGGDGWSAGKPHGCNPVEDYAGNIQAKGTECWTTSYMLCSKSQTIDLVEMGCSPHVLDEVRPDIQVSEWYAARADCGIQYKIQVQLLKNKNDKIAVKKWTFEDTKPGGRDWFQIKKTFTDYEPGVRFIRFYHEGKDTNFWAGRYGAKMTLSSVILDLNHTSDETASTSSP